ncbi:MAG: HEAT repeat domain-containing protein [Aphanocapsa feldmannii 288cV]|nr:MAG: HEAT repeat domain-containing protein [Aphanocapsa feldmannii 288cV]
MTDTAPRPGIHTTDLDPELLDAPLEVDDLLDDPLDAVEAIDDDRTAQVEEGLTLLVGNRDQVMQGLRIFCEHRDSRSIPLLLPLLDCHCPITRMSAVYALGRNPAAAAEATLLSLLHNDCNGFVRKAVAWSLGNYPHHIVLEPLIQALTNDIAAVRLWAASSLADVAINRDADAVRAARVLLETMRIDTEAVVRSNSAWSLSRLHDQLTADGSLRDALVQGLLDAMVNDPDSGVRDDARTALEQLEDPAVVAKLKTLLDEGLLS